jgi:hypothetical protein
MGGVAAMLFDLASSDREAVGMRSNERRKAVRSKRGDFFFIEEKFLNSK